MVGIKLDLSYPKITFSRGRNDGRDSELRSKVPKVIACIMYKPIFVRSPI